MDEAALERLEDLAEEDWGRGYRRAHAQPLQLYRRNRFAARSDGAADGDPDGIEERSSSYQRLMLELPHAQRLTLVRLCKRVASATRPCTA